MTSAELRATRKAIGLTQKQLAKALRLGTWGFQSVAKWEKGLNEIPGPITLGVETLLKEARAKSATPIS